MYKTVDQKLQDINQLLPETDFVAVFGTSHTSGYCERNNEKEINASDYWSENISDLPVVNFSLIGNNNATMAEQVGEFFTLARSQYCKTVICEVRIGEHTFLASSDIIEEWDELERCNFLPQLSNTYALKNYETFGGLFKKFPKNTVHDMLLTRVPISLLKLKRKAQENYLKGTHPIHLDELPNYSYKNLHAQMINYDENVKHTMFPFIQDYNMVKLISLLCQIKGVKFHWFCWDENVLADMDDVAYRVVHNAFQKSSKIFDQEVTGLQGSAVENFKKTISDSINNYMCDCGHYDETVHKFVSEKIKGIL